MKDQDKTTVITYVVLFILAACMFLWIGILAPWDKGIEISDRSRLKHAQESFNQDTVNGSADEPVATATPTPFVKKKSNEANSGCIGDDGLVW